jgi:hypothetical protein
MIKVKVFKKISDDGMIYTYEVYKYFLGILIFERKYYSDTYGDVKDERFPSKVGY